MDSSQMPGPAGPAGPTGPPPQGPPQGGAPTPSPIPEVGAGASVPGQAGPGVAMPGAATPASAMPPNLPQPGGAGGNAAQPSGAANKPASKGPQVAAKDSAARDSADTSSGAGGGDDVAAKRDSASTASSPQDVGADAAKDAAAKDAAKDAGAGAAKGGGGTTPEAIIGRAAGSATENAIAGDSDSVSRQVAAKYAGAAVQGAVEGVRGGQAGMVAGAAKGVAVQAGQDMGAGGTDAGQDTGAGGTGPAGGGGSGKDAAAQEGLMSKSTKAHMVAGSAVVAPQVTVMAAIIAFLHMLKMYFLMLMALIANIAANLWAILWNAFVIWVKGVGSAIAAPFLAVGGAIGGMFAAIGFGTTAVVAPIASIMTAFAVIGSIIAGFFAFLTSGDVDTSANSAALTKCVAAANSTTTVGDIAAGANVSASSEEQAKIVYSVFKGWGMPDENIAGILGNWSKESGVDPTSVESIFTEPYSIGPRKKAAWDGNFTHIPGQAHGGIGLGQWSNGRTTMLLDYAKRKSTQWYVMQTQLNFMVEGDNPSDAAVFTGMVKTSQGTPEAAALYFHSKWERSADGQAGLNQRSSFARMWFGKMSTWTIDSSITSPTLETLTAGAGDVVTAASDVVPAINKGCVDTNGNTVVAAGNITLMDGGMDLAQATAFMDLYNAEGDHWLDQRYGPNGGPGSCESNHAMNCVSFSVYFLNKYTSFQKYPAGDGRQTAGVVASMTGRTLTDTPTVYSVGSSSYTSSYGHTLIVLGVKGDQVIVGEAGYCSFMGRTRIDSAARMKSLGWRFVDVADLVTQTSLPGSTSDVAPAGPVVPPTPAFPTASA